MGTSGTAAFRISQINVNQRERDQHGGGPEWGELAVMLVPEFRKQQRPGRDRQQQADKWQFPQP